VKYGQFYNMLVAVNGTNVTLLVDNKLVFTHTYQPRIVEGYTYGLNYGYVGVGSDNSRGTFDNIRVQVLPPQVTFDDTEDFSDGNADLFTAGNTGGAVWSVSGQSYTVTPVGGATMSLLDLGPNHLNHQSYLEMGAKLNTQDRAGFVFDRYGDESFKYVAIDADADRLVIGHYTKKGGWVEDAFMSTTVNAGQDYWLGVTLKGTTVNATLSGAANASFQAMVGHSFNASTVDGNFGLMAVSGEASFDDVRIKTDDSAFADSIASNMVAAQAALVPAGGEALELSEVEGLAAVAITEWRNALGDADPRLAGMVDVRMTIGDLAGTALARYENGTLTVDADAAGHGWFVDLTPADSVEFTVQFDRSTLRATEESEAFGRMDLLTVLMHEFGHAIGFGDNATGYAVMDEDLEPGVRYLLDELGLDEFDLGGDPDAPIDDATLSALAARAVERSGSDIPSFDFDIAAPVQSPSQSGGARIDWQADSGQSWSSGYSPYASTESAKSASSNFADYLVKLFKPKATSDGYDSLGKSLMGKDGEKGSRR
jgi:hypothetical protein